MTCYNMRHPRMNIKHLCIDRNSDSEDIIQLELTYKTTIVLKVFRDYIRL